ncbi:MAG: HAD family hydrolase [Pseudomonadales bacterium]
MNIVFDIGDVLLRWDPHGYVRNSFPQLPLEQTATGIFRSADWYALDAGRLSRAQAAARFVARTGLSAQMIDDLLEGMPRALQPVPEMVELADRMRGCGHALYLLSNIPEYVAVEALRCHEFLTRFDGAVYSHEILQLKPAPQMYQTLLQRYQLQAAQTVFIDDQPKNLRAANAHGIATVHMPAPTAIAAQQVGAALDKLLLATPAR